MGEVLAEIRNQQGERLDATFREGAAGRRDLVVLGHGVTANKDRPFLVALSDGLAAAGLASLRFSFSGNGASDGRFEDSTVTKEVADLGAVLDRLAGWNVTYAGHSMGGAVGVIRAASDPRIERLISLAGMVHCDDFAQRKFGAQQPGASFMWDKPECPLSQAYVDDMVRIGSVAALGARITAPWLLVHGTADTVVPPQDATDILEHAGENAGLLMLESADHVFTGDATARMVGAVVDWLRS